MFRKIKPNKSQDFLGTKRKSYCSRTNHSEHPQTSFVLNERFCVITRLIEFVSRIFTLRVLD